ncbi:hypothetical protein BO94DRAFT_479214 [Aspergillus sclerotioniger CBS 115572]|uniref:Uncharacterized protein n=1 Tax=Aspergillus sclerotioniger CBS 115572 TaxID=1450535 RepID=A0A317UZ79_9EURO|nr:hypothetical protein BO94DRAFT_479214 [Aspergillus sclerotioniger CBS 115572]PWY67085.1 hypothetical protein BO94DRAFT_479214 [Aspergillus sclerotioniger CBS 115572]
MAASLARLAGRLSTVLAVLFLTSWAATALSFTAINVLNTEATILGTIASISLLTFLVSRLLVRFQPQEGTLAHLLATAHHGSRRGALVHLSFCGTWLYELLSKGVLLLFLTLFGGVLATVIYNDPNMENWSTVPDADQPDASTTALAEIDEFKEKAGFDPTQLFRWIPPQALVYCIALLWINFLSLGLYILGHGLKSLGRVLSSPSQTAKEGKEGQVADKA